MFFTITYQNISHLKRFLSTPIGVCNPAISPVAPVQPCATVCNHHARRGARRSTKK